jgi:multiple sugar transport system ATP-binding protein
VRVVSNQWLGDQSHIAGECAGHLLIAVTSNRIAARPGEVIPFALEPRDLHIFGADGTCIRHAGGG